MNLYQQCLTFGDLQIALDIILVMDFFFGQVGLRHIPYWHLLRSSKYPPPFLALLGVASAYLLVPKHWNPWKSTPGWEAKLGIKRSKNWRISQIAGKICFNLWYEISVYLNRFGRNIISGNSRNKQTLTTDHTPLPPFVYKSDFLMTCSLEMNKHGTSQLSIPALQIWSPLVSIPQTRPGSAAQHSLPRTGLFAASSRGDDTPTPWRGHSDPKEDFPLLQPPDC